MLHNEARQLESLKKHDIENWFIEKVSAKDINRPSFPEMMEFVRAGDNIYIYDFSRIAKKLISISRNILILLRRYNLIQSK